MLAQVEPLSFIAAILGAGGLGVILKIVLNFVRTSQQQTNQVMKETREEFEKFLSKNSDANRESLDNLTAAMDRRFQSVHDEHALTRSLIQEQSRIARDAHRRMAIVLMQANVPAREVGKALDKALDEMSENNGS